MRSRSGPAPPSPARRPARSSEPRARYRSSRSRPARVRPPQPVPRTGRQPPSLVLPGRSRWLLSCWDRFGGPRETMDDGVALAAVQRQGDGPAVSTTRRSPGTRDRYQGPVRAVEWRCRPDTRARVPVARSWCPQRGSAPVVVAHPATPDPEIHHWATASSSTRSTSSDAESGATRSPGFAPALPRRRSPPVPMSLHRRESGVRVGDVGRAEPESALCVPGDQQAVR